MSLNTYLKSDNFQRFCNYPGLAYQCCTYDYYIYNVNLYIVFNKIKYTF